jgi:hypothetical protein
MGIGWIVIAVTLIRSAMNWLRWRHWRELVPTTAGWTLRTAMPLLVCLATLGLLALLVTQLT